MEKNYKSEYEHYDSYRMQMLKIRTKYKTAFIYTVIICIIISFLSIFKVRFQIISTVAILLDSADNFMGNFFGGFTQIFACILLSTLAYFAWANFRKLNIFFFLFYTVMLIFSILNKDWISLLFCPLGIFLYSISFSAMMDHNELAKEKGYPNFQIPVEELMSKENNKDPENMVYIPPGIPGIKSDYDDFFNN